MILVIPCYRAYEFTAETVASLVETVRGRDFLLVLVDNASPEPYRSADFDTPFESVLIREPQNEGNFYPLIEALAYPGQVVALCHNDVTFYEPGWDLRVEAAFEADPLLGGLGFAGSVGIDKWGFWTPPILTNFRGACGATAEAIGERFTDLRPAAAVDGLFMAFRREALSALTLDHSLPPAHWYDYIWSAQLQRAGWRLGLLGVEVDHRGGRTAAGQAVMLKPGWRQWCEEHGVEAGVSPMEAIAAEGTRRWHEFEGFFPCQVGPDWQVA
jgi:GT2 family glycosyltransferase